MWALRRSSSWGHCSKMCCSSSMAVAELQRWQVLSCLASDVLQHVSTLSLWLLQKKKKKKKKFNHFRDTGGDFSLTG